MKNNKFELFSQDDYIEEVLTFLSLCGEKDKTFLDIPKKKRTTEDYARLMYIAKTFGFHKILLRLTKEAESRIDEVCDYIAKIKQDLPSINKWIDDFIENIPSPELKQIAVEFWNEKKKKTEKH